MRGPRASNVQVHKVIPCRRACPVGYLRSMLRWMAFAASLVWATISLAQFDKIERKVRAALADDEPYKALSKSQGALSRKGAPVIFHVFQADAYNRLGEYGKAKQQAELARKVLGMTTAVRSQLMGAYLGMGLMDSAYQLVPDPIPADADAELLYRIGRVHQRRGDLGAALKVLDRAVSDAPSMARLVRERGGVKAMLGDRTGARADLDRAVELGPRDAVNYNSRGYYVHMLNGEHAAAIADMDKAIKQDPNYGYAFSNRGWCRYELGEVQKARKDIELAIRKNPGNAYAYRNLGVIALATGDSLKACEHLTKALALDFTVFHGDEVELLVKGHCARAMPLEHPVPPLQVAPPPVNAPGGITMPKDNAPR